MPRPVKWSRDLHPIRERATRSKTETWSRQDVEALFGISRPSAQSLMKAIGEVQTVGAAHFVDRASLLTFLDEMIAAESIEEALRQKITRAEPPPRSKAIRISLPADLRRAMLPDLPSNVTLAPGRIEITAGSPSGLVEALATLAMVMQNDFDRWERAVASPKEPDQDTDLENWLDSLRAKHVLEQAEGR